MAERARVLKGAAVQVVGVVELQRALRQLDDQLPRQLRVIGIGIARDVAAKARGAAESLGGVAAKAAPAIDAQAQQREASIRLRITKFPMAGGAEFGAYHDVVRRTARGAMRGWNQFPAWRGNGGGAGYFLWPTIRSERDRTAVTYAAAVDDLIRRVGL